MIKIKSGRSRSIKDIFTLSHVNPARFKSLEMRSFLVISDLLRSIRVTSFSTYFYLDEVKFGSTVVHLYFVKVDGLDWKLNGS